VGITVLPYEITCLLCVYLHFLPSQLVISRTVFRERHAIIAHTNIVILSYIIVPRNITVGRRTNILLEAKLVTLYLGSRYDVWQ
jgi:hypothetical protein